MHVIRREWKIGLPGTKHANDWLIYADVARVSGPALGPAAMQETLHVNVEALLTAATVVDPE